jgi:hypothetical protein
MASGIIILALLHGLFFVGTFDRTSSLPTMNLGNWWFHHANIRPWNDKDLYSRNYNKLYSTQEPRLAPGILNDLLKPLEINQNSLRNFELFLQGGNRSGILIENKAVAPWWQIFNWRYPLRA